MDGQCEILDSAKHAGIERLTYLLCSDQHMDCVKIHEIITLPLSGKVDSQVTRVEYADKFAPVSP